ncbi:hypothetical protein KAR91_29720 [Candidatus Pacearchaeota archaeon]|nr:hypothetical protein [Candidatus Pacearchaeota archaeon]
MANMEWWDSRKLSGDPLRDVKLGGRSDCVLYRTRVAYRKTKKTTWERKDKAETVIYTSYNKSYCKAQLQEHDDTRTCAALRKARACPRMR